MIATALVIGGAICVLYFILNAYRKFRNYAAIYNKLPGPGNVHWLLGNLKDVSMT